MMEDLEIFVLAGGKSSRMGSDKGLVMHRGKPMISHILEVLTPLSSSVSLITGNEAYRQFGYPLIEDEIPEQGPCGGVFTALKKSRNNRVLVTACDLPELVPALFVAMLTAMGSADIVYASVHGRPEPLVAIYHSRCIERWEQLIASGTRKMTDFFACFDCVTFEATLLPEWHEKMFMNVNSPKELE